MSARARRYIILAPLVAAIGVVLAARLQRPSTSRTVAAWLARSHTPASTPDAHELPRLVDLGADRRVPCKATAPMLESLRVDYAGQSRPTWAVRPVSGRSPASGHSTHSMPPHTPPCDEGQTTLVLVARPDGLSLAQAERTRRELEQLGLRHVQLILNGVFHARTLEPWHADVLATDPVRA